MMSVAAAFVVGLLVGLLLRRRSPENKTETDWRTTDEEDWK